MIEHIHTEEGALRLGDTITATDDADMDVTGTIVGFTTATGRMTIELLVERDYAPDYVTQVYPETILHAPSPA